MIDSYKKITAFLSIFTISFLLFCYFSVRLGMIHSDSSISAETLDYAYPIIFLFFQIAAIVFTAILPSSRFLIGIPIIISLFAGSVLLNSALSALLVLGFPLALLFWSVHGNITNRIKIHFSVDVRRPLTTFFLFFILFGSFVVVPKYESQIQSLFNNWIKDLMPEQMQTENMPEISFDKSFNEILEEQIAEASQVCQGDKGCETMVEEKFREESAKYLEQNPILSEMDLSSDKPIINEIVSSSMSKFIPDISLGKYQTGNISNGFFWAIIAFLLLSPFSIVLSFFTLLGIRILYAIFRLTGVLHITKKSVQQEVIV